MALRLAARSAKAARVVIGVALVLATAVMGPGLVTAAPSRSVAPLFEPPPASSGTATPARGDDTALRGPFLLVTLPSLGTVTWTCDWSNRHPSFALGYRASPRYATTTVELHTGRRRVARRIVHPGQRTRLPFLSARVQTISFVQKTGAGTLRASAVVDFVPNAPVSYCWEYSPPNVVARVVGRR